MLLEVCGTPEPDEATSMELENEEIVRRFIETVWNHDWTPEEEDAFAASEASGNDTYVPDPIEKALQELCTDQTLRRRRDERRAAVKISGPRDYHRCVHK